MSEGFKKRQDTISDNVIRLAREHPDVLSDYRKLVHYYWYYIDGLKVFIPLNILESLTNTESICRAFRKLKADGFIVEDDATRKLRLENEEWFREYYRRNTK